MEVVFDVHIIPELGINFGVLDYDLEQWGLKPEEAFELAKKNMMELLPARVISMREHLMFAPNEGYLLSSDEGARCLKEPKMEFLVRNETGNYGAGAILYPGVAKYVAKQLQGDFYIMWTIPNEALIIPAASAPRNDPKEMKKFLEETLLKDLPEEAVLSKTLYYYDTKKKEILAVE